MTKRTLKQNNCLQPLCREYAERMNDAGFDKAAIHKMMDMSVPWTADSVRKELFNTIAIAMFEKTSSRLSTTELQDVYKVLDKKIAECTGITLAWPDHNNGGKFE